MLLGWSKTDTTGRIAGLAFLVAFGIAAAWGVRTLMGVAH
jgi:hypothetical protein